MVQQSQKVLDFSQRIFVVSVVHGVIVPEELGQAFVVLGENQAECHFKLLDLIFVLRLDHNEQGLDIE